MKVPRNDIDEANESETTDPRSQFEYWEIVHQCVNGNDALASFASFSCSFFPTMRVRVK
jgi:hypothetical protein